MTDADAQVAAAIEKHGVPRWVAFVPMRVREQASVELKRKLQAEARISEGWSRHGDRLVFGRSDHRTTLIYWAKQNLFAVLTIKEIADQWTNLVREAKNVLPASKVYVGRTVKDAIDAGNMLDAPVFFISAGLGLISQDRLIPSYNLSISPNQKQTPVPGECDLRTTLSIHSCSPSEWWNLLNHQKPMLDILNANEDTLIWIALPSSYINLVQEDLLAILTDVRHSLLQQYQWLFSRDEIELTFHPDALVCLVDRAMASGTGARALHGEMERALLSHMYNLRHYQDQGIKQIEITDEHINNIANLQGDA
jgi:hypothetical protein